MVVVVHTYGVCVVPRSSAIELCSSLGVQRVVWLGELCRKTGSQYSILLSVCTVVRMPNDLIQYLILRKADAAEEE
jgi:hypothetical protein